MKKSLLSIQWLIIFLGVGLLPQLSSHANESGTDLLERVDSLVEQVRTSHLEAGLLFINPAELNPHVETNSNSSENTHASRAEVLPDLIFSVLKKSKGELVLAFHRKKRFMSKFRDIWHPTMLNFAQFHEKSAETFARIQQQSQSLKQYAEQLRSIRINLVTALADLQASPTHTVSTFDANKQIQRVTDQIKGVDFLTDRIQIQLELNHHLESTVRQIIEKTMPLSEALIQDLVENGETRIPKKALLPSQAYLPAMFGSVFSLFTIIDVFFGAGTSNVGYVAAMSWALAFFEATFHAKDHEKTHQNTVRKTRERIQFLTQRLQTSLKRVQTNGLLIIVPKPSEPGSTGSCVKSVGH